MTGRPDRRNVGQRHLPLSLLQRIVDAAEIAVVAWDYGDDMQMAVAMRALRQALEASGRKIHG